MRLPPFETERFFARYEFTTRYLLCASDCESLTTAELLDLAGVPLAALGEVGLGYTEAQGNPQLRAQIAATYETVKAEAVVVLGAPEEGIYVSMRALLEPGDHVVALAPAYDSLMRLAQHISGNVSRWEIQPAEGEWRLDLNKLESLVTPETRLIIVNFPHNPTGYLPTLEELEAIVEVARRNDCWLFADEMYRGLELPGVERLPSVVDLYERSIVLSGLSKVYGLPGLRTGWLIVGDAALREDLLNWKFYTTICPPAPSEFLAMATLRAQEQIVARNQAIISENVAAMTAFLERRPERFAWRPPRAGSIALFGLPAANARAYCHQLAQEAGVLLLPSSCFDYGDAHVRLGFGRRNFQEGLAVWERQLERGDG